MDDTCGHGLSRSWKEDVGEEKIINNSTRPALLLAYLVCCHTIYHSFISFLLYFTTAVCISVRLLPPPA